MLGVITGREVLRNGWTIVREFGPATYGRCLLATATGRPITFLALATQASHPVHGFRIAVLSLAAAAGIRVTVGRVEAAGR